MKWTHWMLFPLFDSFHNFNIWFEQYRFYRFWWHLLCILNFCPERKLLSKCIITFGIFFFFFHFMRKDLIGNDAINTNSYRKKINGITILFNLAIKTNKKLLVCTTALYLYIFIWKKNLLVIHDCKMFRISNE